MLNSSLRYWLFLGLVLAASSVAALEYFGLYNFRKTEIVRSIRIDKVFEKTRIVCVGRLLVNVPENVEIIYGPAEIPFSLEVLKGKGPEMDELIVKRLVEIETEREYAEGRLRLPGAIIGKVVDGGQPRQKLVFGVSQRSGVFYRIQSYLRLDDDIFIQELNAIGKKENYEKDIHRLNSMARLLRSRGEREIPLGAGICVEDGFVMEPPEPVREYVTIGFRLKDFPDVHFSMSATSTKRLDESDALEPRMKQAEENAYARGLGSWYSRIKMLRREARQLEKWKGFEILARLPAQATEGESHEFKYVSQGRPNDPLLPLLELELRTGVKGNNVGGGEPSLTDEEAILLWDRLTNSIRIRPTTKS